MGLLGGNTVMLTSTVYAATHGPGLLGSLGLGGNGDQQGDGQGISLPQAACQLAPLIPLLCQSGTPLVSIPSGVVTLGQSPTSPPPAPALGGHHTRRHLLAPLTGGVCFGIVDLGNCSTSTSSSTTKSGTAKPSTTTTTTTTTTSGSQSTSTPPSVSGSTGNCLLDLLCTGGGSGGSTVSGSSTGSPTPAPSPALSLLGGAVQIGGTCGANNLLCLGGQTTSTSGGSGSGSGSTGASSGACVANLLCLLGSSCTAQIVNTCLVGAILPALPGSSSGSPSDPSGSTGSSGGSAGQGAGGAAPQGGSQPTGTLSSQGSIGTAFVPAGSDQPSGPGGGTSPNTSIGGGADQSVGLVSGLSFGHGLILWPLFGLLDLAALAGLVVVVRRRWSATSS
ncbi:MAG TPA: hypothetical protein VMU20_11195 [Candidatus Dormibacteraeota bacterium]|nr:hypothetical protein [Candidatus Dormibacteraeota bacterium]